MASLTRWTCVWVNFRSWWWTGKPGLLQSKGSQRVGHNWVTELTKERIRTKWKKNPNEWICKCSHRGNTARASVWKDWRRISISPCEHRQRGLLSALGLFQLPFYLEKPGCKTWNWSLDSFSILGVLLPAKEGLVFQCPMLTGRVPRDQGPGQERREHTCPPPTPSKLANKESRPPLSLSRDNAAPQMGDYVINSPKNQGRPLLTLELSGTRARKRLLSPPCGWSHRQSPGQALTPRPASDPLTLLQGGCCCVFSTLTGLFSNGIKIFSGTALRRVRNWWPLPSQLPTNPPELRGQILPPGATSSVSTSLSVEGHTRAPSSLDSPAL